MSGASNQTATLTSTGTVKLSTRDEVIFVPDPDHSSKNGDKQYAIFFAVEGNNAANHSLRDLGQDNKGVRLKMKNDCKLFLVALSAAETQKKVDIFLDQNDMIIDIMVPPK